MPPSESVLHRLLSVSFPGRDELRGQLGGLRIEPYDDAGGLWLSVSSGEPAPVELPVPVEASYPDPDGVIVHVLLHVVDGYLHEVQVFREDGAKVQIPAHEAPIDPEANDLDWDGN